MSPNALAASALLALALTAVALRLAGDPILQPRDGDTLYATAKSGPHPAPLAEPVEMAARDVRAR